jgi:hypothetical protein
MTTCMTKSTIVIFEGRGRMHHFGKSELLTIERDCGIVPEGILDANFHWYNQTTLYYRLNQKKVEWRIYYGDIPQSLILVHQLEPKNQAAGYEPT